VTDLEAARDLFAAHGRAPWVLAVVPLGDRLLVWTPYELPAPLRERLAVWQGYPVEFKATGRECIP